MSIWLSAKTGINNIISTLNDSNQVKNAFGIQSTIALSADIKAIYCRQLGYRHRLISIAAFQLSIMTILRMIVAFNNYE